MEPAIIENQKTELLKPLFDFISMIIIVLI